MTEQVSRAWFYIPAPRVSARTRLFCFPYAGGWPWAFRDWPAALPDDVELYALCLPGRGKRANEAAASSMEELVTALRSAIRGLLDRPFALFGHSFGALVAYELAGELERQGDPLPRRVFVSGCAAPGTHAARSPLHQLPDAELIEVMRSLSTSPSPALDDPGILAVTLSLFRADVRLAESHRSRTAAIAAPLTAFHGDADDSAPREAVAEWRAHAGGSFTQRGFAGDHFFVDAQRSHVLAAVQEGLA